MISTETVVLRRGEPFAQLVVPDHKLLDRGSLPAIIGLAYNC
jgi:hypothetical protein